MSEPKRHHYIPELILKRFTDAKGHLHCCRRNDAKPEYFQTSPKNACVKTHLYTKVDASGSHDASVEKHLSRIESDVANVIEKIVSCALDLKNPKLSADERTKLARFRIHQLRRVPRNRQLVGGSKDGWPEEIRDAFEEFAGRKVTDEEGDRIATPEYREQFRQHAFASFSGEEPWEPLLSLWTSCPIQFGVITQQTKRFVIGDWIEVDNWFPVEQRVAFRYGGDSSGLIEFGEVQEICRINEQTVQQSQTIAGPSKQLVLSVAGLTKS